MSAASRRIGLILAGGQGRRFGGRDKGQVIFKGRRLFDHVYERLTPQVDEIWISGPHDYGRNLRVLPDRPNGPKGPVAALYAVLDHADRADANGVLAVPIDGPYVPLNAFEMLYHRSSSSIARDVDRMHPTYGYWQFSDLADAFNPIDTPKGISLRSLAETVGARYVTFSQPNAFLNINSQKDLERAG